MSITNGSRTEKAPSIQVSRLSYAFADGSSGLDDINLSLPPGSRTLLIGGSLALVLNLYPDKSNLLIRHLLHS